MSASSFSSYHVKYNDRFLLRLDPAVHDALAHLAQDELRSVNAQIELVVRRALAEAGRSPRDARPLPRRGRPPSV